MSAAVASLAFALLDELQSDSVSAGQKAGLKVFAFVVCGYATLYNWTVKNFLIRRLTRIKTRVG